MNGTTILPMNYSRKWRQLRFKVHRKRQKAMDLLVARFAVHQCAVAFGSARWPDRRGRGPRPPVEELRKKLKKRIGPRFHPTSEYLTSARCSHCGDAQLQAATEEERRLKHHRFFEMIEGGVGRRRKHDENNADHEEGTWTRSWTLVRCTQCNKTYDRDKNAAMNMRNVYMWELDHEPGDRPLYLRRPNQEGNT